MSTMTRREVWIAIGVLVFLAVMSAAVAVGWYTDGGWGRRKR